ncbi:Transcription factor SOX-2 [Sarcoptes scabiei]|nr:Transcription factor SOX-2 [Sarcoptes scabiei]
MLMLMIILIFIYYIKIIHYKASNNTLDQSWLFSTNKFNDNLERMRDKLQYAVLIDAGSSGSRVYIYVWSPHSGDLRQLLKIRVLRDNLGKELYLTITPGLSACASNTSNATDYISPLLEFASKHIPKQKHAETPVYLLATAGMRLLEKSIQDAILANLRSGIPKRFSFLFTPKNVEIISGKDEGIYSWIALNYLTGRFDHTFEKDLTTIENDNKRWTRMKTVSMIEMGGASIQIAFEITSNQQYERLKSQFSSEAIEDKISEVNLGCSDHDINHKYRIFVTTFLTLGANAARSNYVKELIDQSQSPPIASKSSTKNSTNNTLLTKESILFDPCLSIDSSETIRFPRKKNESNLELLYHLRGSGNFQQCQTKLNEMITDKNALNLCMNQTCPFKELKMMNVPFESSTFYGLSEFWYSMNDVYHIGGKYIHKDFLQASVKYCSTSWLVTQDRNKRNLYPKADFDRLLHQCFKSAWMLSILHDGFKMSKNYPSFESVSVINDEPVQWTLGALILRTRFFPLRSFDKIQNNVQMQHVIPANIFVQYAVFALCMLAVIVCIGVYLRRLHLMLNNHSQLNLSQLTSKNLFNKDSYTANYDIESFPLYGNHLSPSISRQSQQFSSIVIDKQYNLKK